MILDPPRSVDPLYIKTQAPAPDDRTLVLKSGETFVVLSRSADIGPDWTGKDGLYSGGTRFLSRLALAIGGHRPLLLGGGVRSDNSAVNVSLTNPDLIHDGVIVIHRGTVHVAHNIVLTGSAMHHRLRIRNHGLTPVRVNIDLTFEADFADIFEVRGSVRTERGQLLEPIAHADTVVLAYRGLDGVTRRTRLTFDARPDSVTPGGVRFECALEPHAERVEEFRFACIVDVPAPQVSFTSAAESATSTLASRRQEFCRIQTSNDQFNAWLNRSLADLAMMQTSTRYGDYPYAGVPWFCAPFGRDGIITAFECLWANPGIARGVLACLAATQATSEDPARDAQPGKILHEMRTGEMAARGEVPFDRYYGSHDATPLFVMLAAAYYERTDDTAFMQRIWPSIESALTWIDRYGDVDDDGFIEYARRNPEGLINQGWKDSHDAIFHADGRLAESPVAACEIQAYAYGALKGGAVLAELAGKSQKAAEYATKAEALFEAFDAAFWNESIGTYALALDGDKRPCLVRASNAGHALFAGIASRQRVGSIARTLMSPEGFSGWGIRTVATSEARYNPMAYHNGSIWPHDNAMIAAGLARYGYRNEALAILDGLFNASVSMDLHRLPELFCGFARDPGEAPIGYPVACNPQAWASASVFLLLQAVLGLEIRGGARVVQFTRPVLPAFLSEVWIRDLRIGSDTVDLALIRHDADVGINVLRRSGAVEVVAIK